MSSLRGLHEVPGSSSTSAMSTESASSAATTTSESTSTSTGSSSSTTSASTTPGGSTTVTTEETTVAGGLVTTRTTTTTTSVITTTASTSEANSHSTRTTVTNNNAAFEGGSGTTTTTVTENADGVAPVTTVITDDGTEKITTTTNEATGTTTTSTSASSQKTNSASNTSTSTSTTSTTSGSTWGASSTTEGTSSSTTSTTNKLEGASSSTSTTEGTASSSSTAATSIAENTVTNNGGSTAESTTADQTAANSETSTSITTSSQAGASSPETATTSGHDTSSATTSTSMMEGEAAEGAVTAAAGTTSGSSTSSTSTTTSESATMGSSDSSTSTMTSESETTGSSATTTTGSTVGSSTSTTTSTESTMSSDVAESSTTSTTTTEATSTEGSSFSSSSQDESAVGSLSASASAETGSSASTSVSSSASASSGSSSESLSSWFTSNFRDEETQLVVGAVTVTTTTNQVCGGEAALVTRSSTETPNGGCPDELTALGASCTCLTGYSQSATSWYFHVQSETTETTTTERALTQSSETTLEIDTIRPIWVPASLETLAIEGVGESAQSIAFISENRVATGSSELTLVQSVESSTNVTTLWISNIDLSTVTVENTGFVPTTVTNLTLQNCNISELDTQFISGWVDLEYLDLSSNSISEAYVGGAALRSLDLSSNVLVTFPSESLNTTGLEALFIQNNSISDFNVTEEEFAMVAGLATFVADQPAETATCEEGVWEEAHGTKFCVLGAATAAVPPSGSSGSDDSDDGSGISLLLWFLIAGAILVFLVLLLLLWQRRRHRDNRDDSPVSSPEVLEPTTPKYNANAAFGDALNRDAAAVAAGVGPAGADAGGACAGAGAGAGTRPADVYAGYGAGDRQDELDADEVELAEAMKKNATLTACRLDYNEVALGRCISRGGFGLVFVGSYRGRQVAVKKIRNERVVEREQVEQFVREISLISGLNHPRIVDFIGAAWTTPAELSAVTELMERGDLRDVTRRFKRRGYRLTWEAHKTVIALHIAEALTYLHALSPTVIHRDLKAKNVLLNADMEAKLSDFGIARERSFYDGSEHMTVGIGTSFWIAPEVLLGRDYDEKADIYSFGVVLSEIDTDDYPYWNAQHPPQGKVQENEILRLVARGAKRPAFSDDCPPPILELAAHCLNSEPKERPTAAEIVRYLQQLAQDRSSSVSAYSMLRPGNSFDLNTRSTNSSSPTRTAPANTIVNLRNPGAPMHQPTPPAMASSAAAANAAAKRTTKKTTTTMTTTKVTSGAAATATTSANPSAMEALAPAQSYEVVVSPSSEAHQVTTHRVVRTKLPPKGKTTSTTTTTRRMEQNSSASILTGGFAASVATGSSEGGSASAQSVGGGTSTDSLASSHSHAGLPNHQYEGPTSPASLRSSHAQRLAGMQRGSYSSGEEEKKSSPDRRSGGKWSTPYEDVKEL